MANWRYTVALSIGEYTVAYTVADQRRIRWERLMAMAEVMIANKKAAN